MCRTCSKGSPTKGPTDPAVGRRNGRASALKDHLPKQSDQERAAHDALNTFTTDGFGYFLEQTTRPQTIGYSLLDSPVGLAAWMLDHDTGAGASAARWYWEFGRFLAAADAAGQAPPPVAVPVGFTAFPGEIWAAPRSWVEVAYPDPAYYNAVDSGGHFAAWEEPQLFSTEVRAAFSSLR